ncbi:MAG: hypothetical protein NC412_05375 [Roseburia sp.]|nr:hypothetical protein [Roseburia sp.]
MNKPRRVRIYKLNAFDTFTEEERALNEAYKKASVKEKAILKKLRDNKIAAYEGIRKIDRKKLYTYEYDKDGNLIEESENINNQIALFESEMIRYTKNPLNDFPLVMEIVYMKIAYQTLIFNQILERGLLIDDKKYVFFTSTTNQMKNGEFVLVQEDFYNKNQNKFMCGLTNDIINQKGGCNSGKYLAYKGLSLSSSIIPEEYKIDIDKCLLVPDFNTMLKENVECIDIDHKKREFIDIERRNEEVEIPQTDGAGMFLPGVLPASAQIRCSHLKGAIFPFDFRKFLEQRDVEGVKPNSIIKDAWGNVHDVIKEGIQVIFTASQLKMWKYYSSWEDYKKAFHENGMRISINKFADIEPKGYAKTSYQFIQTLSSEKLTNEKIEELCADTIEYLDKIKTNLDTMIRIAGKDDDYISLALEIHKDLVYDEYIQSRLESKFKSERNDARGNKLILRDSLYSYICPDLYAFCTWLFCGIENPKGIIPRNYVYNSFYNDTSYEVVDCLRSPHLYVEHGIRNLVKDDILEKCKEWFNDYDTVVSSRDLLCRLLMFDVDGDEILLTPNRTIIGCVPDDIVPLYYVPFEPVKSEINNEAIYKAITSCMENTRIGDISNVMTKNYNNPDTDMEFNKVMCCYNNLSIDYPKTQDIVKLGRYEERYNALKAEKNPHFFRYAKGKSKNACKALSKSNADRVCAYIHKRTGNKNYAWKNIEKKFNPSILFNNENPVVINAEKYQNLEKVMFMLKMKERKLVSSINEAAKEMGRSEGWEEKDSQYDVFYHMCEKLIINIFDSREEAAEYLLDMEYLQRENELKSKNILWNCFGDLIYKNICNNLCCVNVRQRRKHYKTSGSMIQKIEEKAVEILKSVPDNSVDIFKEEIEWIDNIQFKRGCNLDRELLYILLVLQKRYKDKVRIYINQKKQLTCNTIDKWLGDGICICKKGLTRLQKMGVISLQTVARKYYEIEVFVPEVEKQDRVFSVTQWNPIPEFYEYNEERKVERCVICGKKFVKIKNMATCSNVVCRSEYRKRNANKCSA